MVIYLATLFIVTLAAYSTEKSKSAVMSRALLLGAFIWMILVPTLRDETVGTDTYRYVLFFSKIRSYEDVLSFGAQTWEIGYWTLNWIGKFISDDYMALFLAISLIVVGCYQRVIATHSANIRISFFIFITMGFYGFFFNAARQGVASAICALAIGPLVDRNLKQYLGYVLLAALFHKSAIIMLPIYFIVKKSHVKISVVFGVVGGIGALYLDNIVRFSSLIDPRYQEYAASGVGGGYVAVLFLCVLCVFFWWFSGSVRLYSEHYKVFLNMFIIGTIMSLVPVFLKVNPSGILRINTYFTVSAVFLWPIVFVNIEKCAFKILLSYVYSIVYLAYFFLTLQAFGELIPYKINPLLLSL